MSERLTNADLPSSIVNGVIADRYGAARSAGAAIAVLDELEKAGWRFVRRVHLSELELQLRGGHAWVEVLADTLDIDRGGTVISVRNSRTDEVLASVSLADWLAKAKAAVDVMDLPR